MGRVRTTTPNLYEANVSLMCSNMEQIITLIGNVMELSHSASSIQKTQLAPSLELDSLNGTVMKRMRETPQLEQTGVF